MERNDDRTTSGMEAAGAMSGAESTGGTSGMSAAGSASLADDQSIKDRARGAVSTAQEKLSDLGSNLRERAGTAKSSLADKLESGADKLRQRAQGGESGATFAGATGEGSTALTTDRGRMSQVNNRVAGGMQATADWLRETDIEKLRGGVEQQVREHPGRTLLVALGVGYLIGKAFRK